MANEHSGFGGSVSAPASLVPLANVAEWSYRSTATVTHNVTELKTPAASGHHATVRAGLRIINGRFIGYASASSPVDLTTLVHNELVLRLTRGGAGTAIDMTVTITEVSEVNDKGASRYRVMFTGGGDVA